jgi:DNA-nicking Smr family endonuclease
MKNLNDSDLTEMGNTDFIPDDKHTAREIRNRLKAQGAINILNSDIETNLYKYTTLDLHHKTEEQAWRAINELLDSGARNATIITGASGILKIKFAQWSENSIIAPRIISYKLINNGAYEIKIKK